MSNAFDDSGSNSCCTADNSGKHHCGNSKMHIFTSFHQLLFTFGEAEHQSSQASIIAVIMPAAPLMSAAITAGAIVSPPFLI